MKPISIPQADSPDPMDYWKGTCDVACPCGGIIRWAEAAYTYGYRACDTCLVLFRVCGSGADRRLVPQTVEDGITVDADEDVPDEDLERVPDNYFNP
jgi:hypothetical protein